VNRRRWGQFVILFIAIIGAAVVTLGFWRAPTPQAEGTSFDGRVRTPSTRPTLRVGTFNIRGGVGLDNKLDLNRTARVIGDCDLVSLNEVQGATLHSVNQARMLGEHLGLYSLYAPSERRWWRESWGNGLLTNLKVEHWTRFPMNKTKPDGYRTVTVSRMAWKGKTINVITTHTDGSEDRDAQLRIVGSLFLAMEEPALLMGDLNTPISHPTIQEVIHTPGVIDPVTQVKGLVPRRIDWIFAKGFKVIDAGIVEQGASDHPFYWADLEFK
jgi:endonuclease/exonuclease/phosphatase family metal-dependent hydrolase